MSLRLVTVVFAAALVALACGGPQETSTDDGTWVGTITTEGSVTTVVNESGSVWGGTAVLVEEASIGVEAGAAEYMLGQVRGLAATDDRIYVLDAKPEIVRVYGYDGEHLFDIGREGQGPGEFFRVRKIVVDARQRLIVQQQTRFSAFDLDGTFLESWPGSLLSTPGVPLVATDEGHIYDPRRTRRGSRPPGRVIFRYELVSVGADGPIGEPLPAPDYGVFPHASSDDGFRIRTPFWPVGCWALTRTGAFVVGMPDAYSFEVRHVDGKVTHIERRLDPFPVLSEEAAWHRASAISRMRGHEPAWSWNGPEVPASKPFYNEFTDDDRQRIWVARPGRGIRIEDCDENPAPRLLVQDVRPCWRNEVLIDVFGPDGRYLGDVIPAEGMNSLWRVVIRGDHVFASMLDEVGTPVVKRYRLVLPGKEQR